MGGGGVRRWWGGVDKDIGNICRRWWKIFASSNSGYQKDPMQVEFNLADFPRQNLKFIRE